MTVKEIVKKYGNNRENLLQIAVEVAEEVAAEPANPSPQTKRRRFLP